MRPRKTYLIILSLCIWVISIYFILIRESAERKPKKYYLDNEFMGKLSHLENNLRIEADKQKTLVDSIVNIIKQNRDFKAATSSSLSPLGGKNVDNLNVVISPEGYRDVDSDKVLAPPLEINEIDNSIQSNTVAVYLDNDSNRPVIPVLVFACNRISVNKCLDNLIEYRPSAEQFPIIVSQDCGDEATRNVILSYKDQVQLITQPDQSDIFVSPREKKFKGYYKISRHYGWALNTTFSKGYEYVIIVEDDLNVAPDFFQYFLGTYPLLKNDPSLWCVSAWNDNGKVNLIDESRPELLYRSDFFPGLGWMLSRNLWNELSVKWPKAFWDDWIRDPKQRKERSCIRPELPRSRTFGKIGVSNGLFFEKHLKFIKLGEEFVDFTKKDLSYLMKDAYDDTFLKHVYETPVVTFEEVRRGQLTIRTPVRIQYNTKDQYRRAAKMLGLMDDFKSGVPRTGYHGIISFFYNNQRVYLAPNRNWKGYDLTWS